MEERILFSQKTTIFVPVDNDSRIKPMSKDSLCAQHTDCSGCPKAMESTLIHRNLLRGQHIPKDKCTQNCMLFMIEGELPRIIEHKHFEFGTQEKTVISKEYSSEWTVGMEPYYPVNDERNNALYQKYKELADKEEHIIFGGRLGHYKYYDMDKVIAAALDDVSKLM